MRHNRILTEDLHRFLTQASPIRNYLIDYVNEHISDGTKSIALCFRGNYATLYYRCHQLLRIRHSRTAIIGEFDFRHARYTQDYLQKLQRITELKVDVENFSNKDGDTSHRFVRFDLTGKNAVACEQLEKILRIYKSLIDDFLDPSKTEYAFDRKTRRSKSANIEKDRQQQLYAAYFLKTGFTYYDLEYAEHYAEKNGVHGRFDLLGLRQEKDSYVLLFTELKSTLKACGGRSGIAEHENDYIKYLSGNLVENRKIEACETVKLLSDIFGKPYPKNLTPENIRKIKVKFVFSDKTISVGEHYTPCDDRIEKAYLCPIEGVEKAY